MSNIPDFAPSSTDWAENSYPDGRPRGRVVGHNGELLWSDAREPNGWYVARVKYDGCIDLYRYHDMPCPPECDGGEDRPHPTMIDYIHLCDIDHEIERLQALKKLAMEKFGKDWPNL